MYAFDNEDYVICEITYEDGYEVEWTVYITNKKASWYEFSGKFATFSQNMRNPKVQVCYISDFYFFNVDIRR